MQTIPCHKIQKEATVCSSRNVCSLLSISDWISLPFLLALEMHSWASLTHDVPVLIGRSGSPLAMPPSISHSAPVWRIKQWTQGKFLYKIPNFGPPCFLITGRNLSCIQCFPLQTSAKYKGMAREYRIVNCFPTNIFWLPSSPCVQ